MLQWNGRYPYGNPETQDIDNDSQDNFQEENIVQQLICKTE